MDEAGRTPLALAYLLGYRAIANRIAKYGIRVTIIIYDCDI